MARPKRIRKMTNPPHFKGFKPIGLTEEEIPIVFNYEEYEAIRLSDFDFLGQMEASRIMGISRSTYARIYESARRKVAQAFILGKAILFEGGKVYFDSEWYSCNSCGCWFNHAAKEEEIRNCTLCGSIDIDQYNEKVQLNSTDDICICPLCGKEKIHSLGAPCHYEICPDCNCQMIRKGAPHQHLMRKRNCN
ncbi:MAG TPA: DUF134 domain-containing protein [Prolixibacteraceae bacterium]|nr:DUF134 domain-containing protein [Prolixibacteraceae bacterium]